MNLNVKNYLLPSFILGLFLSSNLSSYGYTYAEWVSPWGYCPINPIVYQNQLYRPLYNPYGNYYNPYYRNYTVTRTNFLNNQPHKYKRMRRLEKRKLNTVSFLNKNKGSMTGYSVPVNKDDIYKQMGISPYDPKTKQKYNSINCNQELFSSPSGDETYYNNGQYYKDLHGATGKTGVTIIYD